MPLDVIGIDIPAHLRAKMRVLAAERQLVVATKQAGASSLTPAQRREFIRKLAAVDARRSKPATEEEIEEAEDEYMGVPGDDDEDDDIDDDKKRRHEDDEDEGDDEGRADSDDVALSRRGSLTRTAIEFELRRLSKAHSRRTGLSYAAAYAHVATATRKGRALIERYVLATPV